jgi:CheY-like chemotaxis protein
MRQKSILIIDDSEVFLAYLSLMLYRMGYDKIVPASNGVDALRIIKLLLPDVILLDIMMPQMDGVKTLKHIKEDEETAHIPVIMLTTIADMEYYKECTALGCYDYLTKPVKVTALNKTLNSCITYTGGKQRKYLRTIYEKKIALTYQGETREHYAVSLSEGGIYVRRVMPLPIGTEVDVSLPLQDNKTLHLKGSVIYVKSISGDIFKIVPGMAIEFKALSLDDITMLRQHIIELLTSDILDEQEEQVIAKEH